MQCNIPAINPTFVKLEAFSVETVSCPFDSSNYGAVDLYCIMLEGVHSRVQPI